MRETGWSKRQGDSHRQWKTTRRRDWDMCSEDSGKISKIISHHYDWRGRIRQGFDAFFRWWKHFGHADTERRPSDSLWRSLSSSGIANRCRQDSRFKKRAQFHSLIRSGTDIGSGHESRHMRHQDGYDPIHTGPFVLYRKFSVWRFASHSQTDTWRKTHQTGFGMSWLEIWRLAFQQLGVLSFSWEWRLDQLRSRIICQSLSEQKEDTADDQGYRM